MSAVYRSFSRCVKYATKRWRNSRISALTCMRSVSIVGLLIDDTIEHHMHHATMISHEEIEAEKEAKK